MTPLGAVELILTQDELRQLDELSALAREYPRWVLPFQGADRLEPFDRWVRFSEARKPHWSCESRQAIAEPLAELVSASINIFDFQHRFLTTPRNHILFSADYSDAS